MTSSSMRVSKNKAVYVTYVLLDQSGAVFEQSDLPIGYIQGSEKGLFLKLEQQLEGHVAGDQVDVTLSPEEGFGAHLDELLFTDELSNVPQQFHYVGAQVQFENEHGDVKDFVVCDVGEQTLTVDGNHPLAGQTVLFRVTVVDVRDATPDEIRKGEPADSYPMLH